MNDRLIDIDNEKVQFRWKNYRDENRKKTMILAAEEFIRRFLLHVLPDGFQRIRYYGFLANRYRQQKLDLCRRLLDMTQPEPTSDASKDYHDKYEELTGQSLKVCPVCHQGQMVVTEIFDSLISRPAISDTS